MLVFALPSFLSAQVTTKSTELAILVKEIMNTSSNLITEVCIISIDQFTVCVLVSVQIMTVQYLLD